MVEERTPDDAPSLRHFLSTSVRVGSLRAKGATLVLLIAAVAFGLGYVAHSSDAPLAKAPSVPSRNLPLPLGSASSTASVALPPPTSSGSATNESGSDEVDLGHLKSLEAKPARERSIEESIELARGHQRLALQDARALENDLATKRPLDVRSVSRLRDLARDDSVAPDVLGIVARHPSTTIADLLYDVSTDPRASETVRFLADDLLAAPAIRAIASKELTFALDLASAHACEAVALVVKRAKSSADDRALPLLRALDREKGCGKEGKEDCYPCLRNTSLLFEARDAAAGRAFLPSWKPASQ